MWGANSRSSSRARAGALPLNGSLLTLQVSLVLVVLSSYAFVSPVMGRSFPAALKDEEDAVTRKLLESNSESESVSAADANVQQNSQNNVGADTENLGQCWCEDYYGDGCSCSFHEGGWGGGGPGYGFDGPGYGGGGPGDGGWGGGYHETLVDGKKTTQEVPDQEAKDLMSQQESDLAGKESDLDGAGGGGGGGGGSSSSGSEAGDVSVGGGGGGGGGIGSDEGGV
ncbi:unnamed protein product [Sphagnum jensenii]|uniref:Glycine-rich protein n=1 Tax=Sphagnum jensenii TaxID=128206 RepID=A0ABP0WIZ2_9BRYO